MEAEITLQKAINVARSGRKLEAQKLLKQILQNEPRQEQAWIWLSSVVETNEQRIECLKRALNINPNNIAAKKGLVQLRKQCKAPASFSLQTSLPEKLVHCLHCNLPNQIGNKFCIQCGYLLQGEKPPPLVTTSMSNPEDLVYCLYCGSSNQFDAKSCLGCGYSFTTKL
ncbi:MAG: zinc ribbon domain-containing protein [Anaerolineae bacterium]|nr:zinc ribbon domain-containing protein [Anaerolineae bacterium]